MNRCRRSTRITSLVNRTWRGEAKKIICCSNSWFPSSWCSSCPICRQARQKHVKAFNYHHITGLVISLSGQLYKRKEVSAFFSKLMLSPFSSCGFRNICYSCHCKTKHFREMELKLIHIYTARSECIIFYLSHVRICVVELALPCEIPLSCNIF